jgi:hypothetical protein
MTTLEQQLLLALETATAYPELDGFAHSTAS